MFGDVSTQTTVGAFVFARSRTDVSHSVTAQGREPLSRARRRRHTGLPRDAAEPLPQRRRSAALRQRRAGGRPRRSPAPAAGRWARPPRNKGSSARIEDKGGRRSGQEPAWSGAEG